VKVIDTQQGKRIIYYDVDDTLVMWDKASDPKAIEIEAPNRVFGGQVTYKLLPHARHISHLKANSRTGNIVVVWSAGGNKWAEAVIKKLELEPFVDVVLTKPDEYVDDLDCYDFMGARTYKFNPETDTEDED